MHTGVRPRGTAPPVTGGRGAVAAVFRAARMRVVPVEDAGRGPTTAVALAPQFAQLLEGELTVRVGGAPCLGAPPRGIGGLFCRIAVAALRRTPRRQEKVTAAPRGAGRPRVPTRRVAVAAAAAVGVAVAGRVTPRRAHPVALEGFELRIIAGIEVTGYAAGAHLAATVGATAGEGEVR